MTVQCCIRRYRTANDYWTIQDYSGLYGPVRDSKGPYVTIFYFLYCYEIEKNLGEIVQIGKIVQIVEIVHKITPVFGATYTKKV